MATYRAAAYKLGPALGNVNADNGWGGYKWPGGVPTNLLGTASYGAVKSLVRRELVTLFSLAYRIAKDVHGYTIWTTNPSGSGEPWGPWGYENRAISGTTTASNHSRGRANDWNAPFNGYADGFASITSDFPPAMVRDLEAIGLSWGGRYGDAMHLEYARTPGDVPADEARARAILGGKAIGTAPEKPAPANDPTPVMPDLTEDDEQMMRLAVADDSGNGAVFAFSPGRFIHLNPDQLSTGQAAGILPDDRSKDFHTSRYGLDLLRDLCVGNGAGKGDNLIGTAPSEIATPK